jgi:hypothetical protein
MDRDCVERQAERQRRPSIGRIMLEIIAWISESNWRISAMIAGAIIIGSVAGLVLP